MQNKPIIHQANAKYAKHQTPFADASTFMPRNWKFAKLQATWLGSKEFAGFCIVSYDIIASAAFGKPQLL